MKPDNIATSSRLLMCKPTAYDLCYEINPWMKLANKPDRQLAIKQWEELYLVLTEEVGAEVVLLEQAQECPDMVFTANAGLVLGNKAILSNFKFVERQAEQQYFKTAFGHLGYSLEVLPESIAFEGEGDALFAGDILVAGYNKRTDISAHGALSRLNTAEVLSLKLVDDRWYHLDTCFLPLRKNTVAYYPQAFDEISRALIEQRFSTIKVKTEEALKFSCNAVVLGQKIVMPSGCDALARELEDIGYAVFSVPMGEFIKAGGACKCLVLYL